MFYLFLPPFLYLILIIPAACSQLTLQSIRMQEPHFTHRPSLHLFCNFFASWLFSWHCFWLTSSSWCTWRIIFSYPWCSRPAVVQSVFQLFLFCPYVLLVIFHTQSMVSEHGFFLLCTCWSVCLLLQGLSSTVKAPLLPLKAALSAHSVSLLSLLLLSLASPVASCCSHPTM